MVRPRIFFSCALALSTAFSPTYIFGQTSGSIPFTCNESELQFAGAFCTPEEPCPVYLELSAVANNGNKLFAGGNLHTESATLGSILLVSEDSGTTWKEAGARMQASAFDQIQFLDAQHGWVSGETQNPLPRDPFVMLTTNGGDDWRKYAIGEEGGAGSVVRFWFDSVSHGELIVDAGRLAVGGRYQLYESETGGTSWTLRSKTDQMPKQPAAHESTEVRLRPAKDGKTVAIEKRLGENWQTEASLLIEAARCSFEPGQLKEPEPDSPAK
jgi:photosystem II stability/assembly factor-like uncharacterized protein